MARTQKPGGSVRHQIYLSTKTSRTLEILLANPITGRPQYGAISSLIEGLIIRWIEDQRRGTGEAESRPTAYDFRCSTCGRGFSIQATKYSLVTCPQCGQHTHRFFDPALGDFRPWAPKTAEGTQV